MSAVRVKPDFHHSRNAVPGVLLIKKTTMKTLLVPTDFSSTAANALFFAIALADKLNAEVLLMHAYELPVAAAGIPYELWHEEQTNRKAEAERQLRTECERLVGQVKIGYKAIEGAAVDSVLEMAKDDAFEFIIMGTNGAGNHTSGFFGSTTSHIIEQARIPVIAVPERSYFKNEIRKITFATDYHASDVAAANQALKLAAVFNANLTLLHIATADTADSENAEQMNQFMKRVRMRAGYSNLSYEILVSDNVGGQLEEYINAGRTDVMAMSTYHRGFFGRIFQRSYTKEMALKMTIPLIVFHHKR